MCYGKQENQILYSLIYTRLSSSSQKFEGSGDASQEVRCIEYSNQRGYVYEKTFEDVFTGGGSYLKRKGMVQLLNHIDRNRNKRYVVIFDDLKRFARDVKFHISLREELVKRKARVESPNFNFDDSPEGEAHELYTAVANQLERKQNQRQVIQKQTARLMDGFWAFHAPLGYSMLKKDGYGKVLMPNGYAPALQEAFEKYADMRLMKRVDVAKFLKDKGIFGYQHPEKYIDTVTSILQNIIYAGYIEYPRRGIERRKGKHKGIISLETYEIIQKRLKKSENTRLRQDIRDDFSLRGLINCAHCKNKLTSAYVTNGKQAKKYAYYHCCTPGCVMRSKTINRNIIEKQFNQILINKNIPDEIFEFSSAIFDDAWATGIENYEAENQSQVEKRAALENEISSLVELSYKTQSPIVRSQYERKIENLGLQLEQIEEILNKKVTDYNIPFQTCYQSVAKFLKSPYVAWHSWSIKQKHSLYSMLFDGNLEYTKEEGFLNPKMSIGIRVLEQIATSNSGHVEIDRNTLNSFREFLYIWHTIINQTFSEEHYSKPYQDYPHKNAA